MTAPKDIAEVLERMAGAVSSLMDSARPSDATHECFMCTVKATEDREHDPWCGYLIARTQLAPSDIDAVRRLARTLRYQRGVGS